MTCQTKPSEVLLIGSSRVDSTSDFFTKTIRALPNQLRRIPDGETGNRSNFIAWQLPTFPITIVQPRWGGQPSAESGAKQYTLEDIKPTGYDDQAIVSYATFCELRDSGTIPAGVRFQVSLPTPLTVVRGLVEDDRVCAQVEPLYEQRLLSALRRIQDHIPRSDLTIQWDLPIEIAMLEYNRHRIQDKYCKPYFTPVKAGILDRLTRLAAAVDLGVEMGYHLCYGDMGHTHFVQPDDTGLMVELANEISKIIQPGHPIEYIHMPVPKDRVDEGYFKPMQKLKLGDSKLYLGLVHPNDGSGTKKRLEAAEAVHLNIAGVASECGLGRTPRVDFESILEICASVTS
jgi:hypothetical protein